MAENGGVSRRRLILGGATSVAAIVASGRASAAPPEATARTATGESSFGLAGAATVPCSGDHQAGIATPLQSFATFAAFALRPGVDRAGLTRLMKLWTDDISRLTDGRPSLGDPVPELAGVPARLTVTVGFGPGVFAAAGLESKRPKWLKPLPAFKVDALESEWTGGDLLLQLCADDQVTISHALQVLTTTAGSFAAMSWQQKGFQRATGMTPEGSVHRNLMGFIDGIVNPRPGTPDFDSVVWQGASPTWLVGGTAVVLRRFRFDLDRWTSLSTRQREEVFGRRVSDGSPLSGTSMADTSDLNARDANGLSAIPTFAHIRLAAPAKPGERILRRPYNFDDGFVGGVRDSGLIFAGYCADPERQFVPIQQRLAEHDLLNTWIRAVGSAVFAIPPGFQPGTYLGQQLLG